MVLLPQRKKNRNFPLLHSYVNLGLSLWSLHFVGENLTFLIQLCRGSIWMMSQKFQDPTKIMLPGFDFRTKKWLEFVFDAVHDLILNTPIYQLRMKQKKMAKKAEKKKSSESSTHGVHRVYHRFDRLLCHVGLSSCRWPLSSGCWGYTGGAFEDGCEGSCRLPWWNKHNTWNLRLFHCFFLSVFKICLDPVETFS